MLASSETLKTDSPKVPLLSLRARARSLSAPHARKQRDPQDGFTDGAVPLLSLRARALSLSAPHARKRRDPQDGFTDGAVPLLSLHSLSRGASSFEE